MKRAPEGIRRYYGFVKQGPCAACGDPGVCDAAHVRVVLSSKTGMVLPRSHKGRAAWGCIALCKACHLRLHEIGEERFAIETPIDYGMVVTTNLIRYFVEERGCV